MDVPGLRRSLLRWFSKSKRPLPWRRSRDAYAIWVSEMMLQQTTVATVIPYYERFMKRFPDLASLARSREDEVLALWSGLGYYSRARNLRLAAKQIREAHGGRFPREVEAAMTLKGVGRYTASAVTSMAYGTPGAAVDGNVRRVLSRLHAARRLRESDAQARAQALLPPRAPGAWNEAMMELGATVCTPRKPRCGACPVASHCLGRGRPEHWSESKPGRKAIATVVEMALVERGGRILLVRNPEGGLMGGLYELPHGGLPRKTGPTRSLHDRYGAALRIDSEAAARFKHAITHHRIEAAVFRAALRPRADLRDATFHSPAEAQSLPLGGLTGKALRAVGLVGD
jgi:A/G-specific adenine glycosylase